MREIKKNEADVFEAVYHQLEEMDFSNFICSPLVNGGCGLGKTTALTDPRIYQLFARKLNKKEPQILVIESRSATRDQLRQKNVNPNYYFLQFTRASQIDLSFYDIIIIDEAHSLFSDAEFAPRTTAPLAEWLKKSLCFQIYITASDVEFISFANKYFDKEKEFKLTFPDLSEAYVRYTAKEMYLSISSKTVDKVIARKAHHFFTEKKKGLFFILSAKRAVQAYQTYSELGKNCAFYVSQQNTTQIVEKEDTRDDDPEFFDEYGSHELTINVRQYADLLERQRKQDGQETVREALLAGRFPANVDYLFMTSAGQEGISLYDVDLDFVFIEDTYPLTINQKIFRYRNNVEEVFIHLPQRSIQNALTHTLQELQELMEADQSFLAGYYKGMRGSKKAGIIWFNPETQQYEIAKNYLAFILTKSESFRLIRDNITDENFLRETYGQYADVFHLINSQEDEKVDILTEFFRDKNGELLTESKKKKWLEELKERGLTNTKQEKTYTFDFVIKFCRVNNICDFVSKRASKQDIKQNSELEHRKKYLQVKWIEPTELLPENDT